jgi:hypothetical protein
VDVTADKKIIGTGAQETLNISTNVTDCLTGLLHL